MKHLEEFDMMELDTIKEICSIGTGNAATALSGMIGKEVKITVPDVRIMGYNEAIDWIGGPESITAGVLVGMSKDLQGVILSVQQLEFISMLTRNILGHDINAYEDLTELESSALVEVGNIMISSFVSAICKMVDINIKQTVPAFAVDMQGAILAVPMVQYGVQSDYVLMVGADFVCDNEVVPSRIVFSPSIKSLNFLLKKLGVLNE